MAAPTRALLSPLGITPALVRVEAAGPPAHSASQASEWLVGVMNLPWPEIVEGLPGFQEGSVEPQGEGFPRFLQALELPSLTLWEHSVLASSLTPAFFLLMLLWVTTCLHSPVQKRSCPMIPPSSSSILPLPLGWTLCLVCEPCEPGSSGMLIQWLSPLQWMFWHCWGNVTVHGTRLWSAWKMHGEECYSLVFFYGEDWKFPASLYHVLFML